jgi:hypothetical protein
MTIGWKSIKEERREWIGTPEEHHSKRLYHITFEVMSSGRIKFYSWYAFPYSTGVWTSRKIDTHYAWKHSPTLNNAKERCAAHLKENPL